MQRIDEVAQIRRTQGLSECCDRGWAGETGRGIGEEIMDAALEDDREDTAEQGGPGGAADQRNSVVPDVATPSCS